MRSYFNGSGGVASSTPPPGGPGRVMGGHGRLGGGLLPGGRASSSSLPRSPGQGPPPELTGQLQLQDNRTEASLLVAGSGSQLGASSGSGQSGHGSLGSHSSHEVSYMNIYQNTNHPHLYDSNLDGSPRHSLGSNNSSNLSTPPSPAREMGSSSYES